MKNIHKKINFFDPQITVKKKLVNEKFQYLSGTKMPLPSEVEISESGTCNRKCSFCPRSDPNYLDIKEFIKPALHEKLHRELAELNFSGTVRYSGFVEPLVDKNIYNLLRKARSINKKVNLVMITNGDILNSDFYYLRNNDLIYVPPLKYKGLRKSQSQILLSTLTTFAILFNIYLRITE